MNNSMNMSYLSQLRVPLITARYATTPLTWKEPASLLAFNKLYYIRSGEGCITINDKRYFPQRGDLVLIPEGCQHAYSLLNDQPYTKYWCHFSASIASQPLTSLFSFPSMIKIDKEEEKLETLFRKLIEAYESPHALSTITAQASMLEIVHFFLQAVAPDQLTSQTPDTSTDMSLLLQYIDRHLGQKITLQDLASTVNLHPNYLVRLFKAHFGFTPIQYVNLQRVQMAKALLKTPTLSIKSIADQTGFESPYYFTQVFKKHTGLSPTEYRNC